MLKAARDLRKWIVSLNSVDVPGDGRFHRFVLSARLGLWPAIIIGSFAFGHLFDYNPRSTFIIAIDLCLVASIAFLFNDACDAQIDKANNVHRWSILSKNDIRYFAAACVVLVLVLSISFFWLSTRAFAGVLISVAMGIAYSLLFKKILLLGNLVAALLSISPGLIIAFDLFSSRNQIDSAPGLTFLTIAFLLLISREVKFDQFDIEGDRVGRRSTLPMILSSSILNRLHGTLAIVAICMLLFIIVLAGKNAWAANLLVGLVTCVFAAGTMLAAYRSNSKEVFYKKTRLVMLLIPISILLSF